MELLFLALGTAGDVHPHIAMGRRMQERGHRAALVASPHFEREIRVAGLGFYPAGSTEDFDRVLSRPEAWHPRDGFRVVAEELILRSMRPLYDLIRERYRPGELAVVGSGLCFGARIAQEKLGVPLITVHLQPACFRSVHHPPRFANRDLPRWLPDFCRKLLYQAADRLFFDKILAPETNAFRSELGLPPVRSLVGGWWHSPLRTLGLFPEWFAPAQPDWPPQTRLTGFPLFDSGEANPMPAELQQFLGAGEPPVVFTPGSGMRYGRRFFEASAEACRRLRRRGVFLTRYREQVPANLPHGVLHSSYAPFGALLPRAAALVHHGGIGTTAQALAAGIPQVVHPFSHDQFDNAARLARLGVGRTTSAEAGFTDPLQYLLGSAEAAARCASLAEKVRECDGAAQACDEIERAARGESGLIESSHAQT